MKLTVIATTILLIFIIIKSPALQTDSKQKSSYRVVFYNVENYFDPVTDSTREYNEFVSDGTRHWTWKRYEEKRNKVYKVITAIGEGEPVSIIALAEIENAFVLEDLLGKTPLKNKDYHFIHFESPDERGIDVGLIFLEEHFKPLFKTSIAISYEKDSSFKTRDILYVKGLLGSDSLHLFINHWPSRYGGLLETRDLRLAAAKTLKSVTDSICRIQSLAAILVMGDFNDNPYDESIRLLTDHGSCSLLSIPVLASHAEVKGSMKYRGNWESFDQVLVSEGISDSFSGLAIVDGMAHIFSPDFLLKKDEKYLGVKPLRTYEGFNYTNGFSDHLPIFVDIYHHKPK